ncbi:hypothetical protein [Actinophytocola sp.]|uniref:hypothetical protein n=1 Tax=Actinophytocola sp. TaxID=1872138 RepID=UPI003D6B2AE9
MAGLVACHRIRLSTLDGPARLLAVAVGSAPAERRDWGGHARRAGPGAGAGDAVAVAVGCAAAAMFRPRARTRVPVPVAAAVAVAVAAVVATGYAVGATLPELSTFAVAFAVIVGVLGTLAVARGRRIDPLGGAVGLAGVGGGGWLVADLLATHPSTAAEFGPVDAVALAVLLAGCGWATRVPRPGPPRTGPAGWWGRAPDSCSPVGCGCTRGWTWTGTTCSATCCSPPWRGSSSRAWPGPWRAGRCGPGS